MRDLPLEQAANLFSYTQPYRPNTMFTDWQLQAESAEERLAERAKKESYSPPKWWANFIRRTNKTNIKCYRGTMKSFYTPGAIMPPSFIANAGNSLPQWLKDEIDEAVDKSILDSWEGIQKSEILKRETHEVTRVWACRLLGIPC